MSVNKEESVTADIMDHWNLQKILGNHAACDRLKIIEYSVSSSGLTADFAVTVAAYRADCPDPLYRHIVMLTAPKDVLDNYEDAREFLYYMFEFMILKQSGETVPAGTVRERIKTADETFLKNVTLDFEDISALEEEKKEIIGQDVNYNDGLDAEEEAAVFDPSVYEDVVDDSAVETVDDAPAEISGPSADSEQDAETAVSKYGSEYSFDISGETVPDGITVCIPTHNVEQYIARTLDSIRLQTHEGFKVIIRDDCSEDGTVEKIRAYLEKHELDWALAVNEENLGVNMTRALLAEAAGTSHVLFMDDDDYFTKITAIETLSGHLDRDIIAFAIESPRIMTLDSTLPCPPKDIPIFQSLINKMFIGRPSFVYRRSLFSGFTWHRHHNYAEDYFMNAVYLLKQPAEYICDEVLYHWSERYGSLSQQGDAEHRMKSQGFYRKEFKRIALRSEWFNSNREAAVQILRGRL